MKERPILFNSEMVRAVLDGRKTQTRRIVKPQPRGIWGQGVAIDNNLLGVQSDKYHAHANVAGEHEFIYCPFGKPGDRLWVRETFSYSEMRDTAQRDVVHYWVDGNPTWGNWTRPKPSIHMPRWASRINLEIKDVRVERLKEVSHDDVLAEGLKCATKDGLLRKHGLESWPWQDWHPLAQGAFCKLWTSIYGDGSWDENPWVWVVEFERCT